MLKLINALLPLVANLAPVIAGVIAQLKEQGEDSDSILAHASAVLDLEQVELLREQLRLQEEVDDDAS